MTEKSGGLVGQESGADAGHPLLFGDRNKMPKFRGKLTPEEIEACAPFLTRQIELLSPSVLVVPGGAAAKTILGVSEGIMRLRGKWLTYPCAGRDLPALATLHPAYLLRKPEQKRCGGGDVLMLKAALDSEIRSQ